MCATFGKFGSLTNIFCPSGHWSSLVTMKTVNSPSVIAVVQSGGADTTLHILQTLGPRSAALTVGHVHIVICMMADPGTDTMKACLSVYHLFSCCSKDPFVSSVTSNFWPKQISVVCDTL